MHQQHPRFGGVLLDDPRAEFDGFVLHLNGGVGPHRHAPRRQTFRRFGGEVAREVAGRGIDHVCTPKVRREGGRRVVGCVVLTGGFSQGRTAVHDHAGLKIAVRHHEHQQGDHRRKGPLHAHSSASHKGWNTTVVPALTS